MEKKNEKNTQKKDLEVDLLAKFKPKPGSWECEACYVNNPAEVCTYFPPFHIKKLDNFSVFVYFFWKG